MFSIDPGDRELSGASDGPRALVPEWSVMYGLFGFVGDGPRLSPLGAVLNGAATRGPLVWGIAQEVLGRPIRSVVEELAVAWRLLETSSCFIGHARPATSDRTSRGREEGVQPLVEGRTAVSHNGTVRNTAAITRQLEHRTPNDSESLLHFVAASHGDFGVRVLAAMQQLPPAPHALLVMEPNAIVAARQSARVSVIDVNDGTVRGERQGMTEAHPLFYAQREEGTYLCSRRVLGDMHSVEGVMTFRLMEEAAQGSVRHYPGVGITSV